MNYKRNPSGRKYSYNAPRNSQPEETLLSTTEIVEKNIPLPNEIEDEAFQQNNTRKPLFPPFLNNIMGRIGSEELLIAGLIFLLLIDGIEDEFLIIILLFILFT